MREKKNFLKKKEVSWLLRLSTDNVRLRVARFEDLVAGEPRDGAREGDRGRRQKLGLADVLAAGVNRAKDGRVGLQGNEVVYGLCVNRSLVGL